MTKFIFFNVVIHTCEYYLQLYLSKSGFPLNLDLVRYSNRHVVTVPMSRSHPCLDHHRWVSTIQNSTICMYNICLILA